jgi:hypothetical protein
MDFFKKGILSTGVAKDLVQDIFEKKKYYLISVHVDLGDFCVDGFGFIHHPSLSINQLTSYFVFSPEDTRRVSQWLNEVDPTGSYTKVGPHLPLPKLKLSQVDLNLDYLGIDVINKELSGISERIDHHNDIIARTISSSLDTVMYYDIQSSNKRVTIDNMISLMRHINDMHSYSEAFNELLSKLASKLVEIINGK